MLAKLLFLFGVLAITNAQKVSKSEITTEALSMSIFMTCKVAIVK